MKLVTLLFFIPVFILGIILGDYGVRRGYLGRRIDEDKAIRDAHNVVVYYIELEKCKNRLEKLK